MGLYDMIKDASRVARDAGHIDLYSQLLDLQAKVMELQHENDSLKKEISALKDTANIADDLIVKGHFYYKLNNEKEDGPFCTSCWDNNSKLIRAHISELYSVEIARCPVCEYGSDSF